MIFDPIDPFCHWFRSFWPSIFFYKTLDPFGPIFYHVLSRKFGEVPPPFIVYVGMTHIALGEIYPKLWEYSVWPQHYYLQETILHADWISQLHLAAMLFLWEFMFPIPVLLLVDCMLLLAWCTSHAWMYDMPGQHDNEDGPEDGWSWPIQTLGNMG